jgi:hypothetical protein
MTEPTDNPLSDGELDSELDSEAPEASESPAPLPPELQGPKILRETETGQLLGHLTAEEFEFLATELERETSTDTDFYIDSATIDMLESDGAPESLIATLRKIVGSGDGVDVTWTD